MSCHTAIRARALSTLGTLALAASGSAWAQKQSWDYKAYLRDPVSGQYTPERFVVTTIALDESGPKPAFRMTMPGRGDPCFSRGDLPAEVERTAETLTITVMPIVAGCDSFRYIIRNDGSGGVRQFRREERWVTSRFEHGLTPTK
jgi:hypothetical protein